METFAPILYVKTFAEGDIEGAIAQQNAVDQGLSSAIFTDSVTAMERFWARTARTAASPTSQRHVGR